MTNCFIWNSQMVCPIEKFSSKPSYLSSINNAKLKPGDFISSSDGNYVLIYQNDGNLVMYPRAIWSTNTFNNNPGDAIIGPQGNFRLRDINTNTYWDTKTGIPVPNPKPVDYKKPEYKVIMQKDRNLVIYDGDNNPLWASGTNISYNGQCMPGNC